MRGLRIPSRGRRGTKGTMSLRYRALLAAGFAIAALWSTWPPLIELWIRSTDYEHGPLACLIALVWMVRASAKLDAPPRDALPHRLRAIESWFPAVLLAITLGLWLIASRANVEIGKQALAPVILWFAVATAAGWRGALSLTSPILYLYFAIPIWEQIVPLLQWLAVTVVHASFALAGVPVRIDGILITIPEGSFIVLEGCSGKRYLIVALATAGLLAAVYSMGWQRTLRYLGFTAALALVANWIRVIIVIATGHLTNMTSYLVTHEHFSLGWAIFAVLLAAVWLLGRKLEQPVPQTPARPADKPAPQPGATELAVSLGLLCIPALAMLCAPRWPVKPEVQPSLEMPRAGAEWQGPLPASGQWLPNFSGAASETRASFESNGGVRVETYWAAYGRQTADAKLIRYSNTLVNDRWLTLERSASVRVRAGHEVRVRTLLLQATSGSRWMVDYYYVVGDVSVTQEWEAQVLYGALSWIRPEPSAVIAVAAPCALSCASAEQALAAFWASSRMPDAVSVATLGASGAYTERPRPNRS